MLEVRRIKLESSALKGSAFEVSELKGREAISELFEFELLVAYLGTEELVADDLIGTEASLVFQRNDVETRRIWGMIAVVHDRLETEPGYTTLWLRFVPRAYKLSLVETLDVFLDTSVPDLLRKKLTDAGWTEAGGGGTGGGGVNGRVVTGAGPGGGSPAGGRGGGAGGGSGGSGGEPDEEKSEGDFELRLYESYPLREIIVQYRETDLAFLSRLCEHLGISYFFEHANGRDVLVFTDMNEGFPEAEGAASLPYRPRGEERYVYRFEERLRMIPAQYVVRDYNYRTPQVTLTGQSLVPAGKGSVVEYGAHVKTPEEADAIAKIRAEERLVSRRVFEGVSDVEAIPHGGRMLLAEHPKGDLKLLVTEVTHAATQSAFGAGAAEGEGPHYKNEFRAIREAVRFRPARVTPKPRIHGVVTGVVDAEIKGQYAEIDEQGRYRVKFLFDTTGPGEGQASSLVRMAQPHAGAGYGMHFPLRPGVEVLLTFMDGDPDRPIISATVPNPQTASPVIDQNAPRNIIRTGGGNEINIDDTEDEQRVKLHSPHSHTTFQLGSPNAPERGAVLETWGAETSLAVSGTATLSSSNNALTLAQTTLSAGNIINKAGGPETDAFGKFILGLNLFTGAVGGLADTANSVVAILQKEEDAELARKKQRMTETQEELDNAIYRRVDAILAASPGADRVTTTATVKKEFSDNIKRRDDLARMERLEGKAPDELRKRQSAAADQLKQTADAIAALDPKAPDYAAKLAALSDAKKAIEKQQKGLEDELRYAAFPKMAEAQKALSGKLGAIAEKKSALAALDRSASDYAAKKSALESEIAALETDTSKEDALKAATPSAIAAELEIVGSGSATQAEKDAAQARIDAALRRGPNEDAKRQYLDAQAALGDPSASDADKRAAAESLQKLGPPSELTGAQWALDAAEEKLKKLTPGTPEYAAAKEQRDFADATLKAKVSELTKLKTDNGPQGAAANRLANLASSDEAYKKQAALDAAKAEYDRAKWEFDNGEHTRNLKQAKLHLDQIKGYSDYGKQTLALYSTLTKLWGMLGESKSIKDVKGLWDEAHSLIDRAKVLSQHAENPLPQASPAGSLINMTNNKKLALLLLSPLLGPVASLPALLLAFKVLFETDSPTPGRIGVDVPYPIYNIQQSKGSAVLYGEHSALVAGRVAVLLARKKAGDLQDNAGSVVVTGETAVVISSPKSTEICGVDTMRVTSDKHVEVRSTSGDLDIDIKTTTKLVSGDAIAIESKDKEIGLKATAGPTKADNNIRFEAANELEGKAKDIKLHAQETAELLAGGAWGLKVSGAASPSVTLGNVTGAWKLEIKPGSATIEGPTGGLSIDMQATELLQGQTAVQLTQAGAMVKAPSNIVLDAVTIIGTGRCLLG